MTLSEARNLVATNPNEWRAAIIEAPGTPALDHPQAQVTLHETVGAAHDHLRIRKEALVADGWRVERGNLGRGVIVFARGDEKHVVGIDKKKRRRAA